MRWLRNLFVAAALAALAAGLWLGFFATRALPVAAPIDLPVRPGAGVASVARQLTDAGILLEPYTLRALARLSDRAAAIQAGTYRLDKPITPLELLDKL